MCKFLAQSVHPVHTLYQDIHFIIYMRTNSIKDIVMNKDLSEEDAKKLMNWYLYYHKLATCYKWKYKKLEKIKLALNMSLITLTVIGRALVPFTHFISLSITGVNVLIQGYLTKSDIDKKVESCKFAYINYNKILIQLKTYFRGIVYDETVFLTDTKVLDDIMVDLCPTINGMSDRYDNINKKN